MKTAGLIRKFLHLDKGLVPQEQEAGTVSDAINVRKPQHHNATGYMSSAYADKFFAENKDKIDDPNLIQQGLRNLNDFLGSINPFVTKNFSQPEKDLIKMLTGGGQGNTVDGVGYKRPTTLEEQYGGDKGFNTEITPSNLVEDLNNFRENFSRTNAFITSPDQRFPPETNTFGGGNKTEEAFPTQEEEVTTPGTGGGGRTTRPEGPKVEGIKFDPNNPFQVGADFKPPQLTGEAIAASPGVDQDVVNATGGAGNLGNIAGYAGQIGSALFKTFPGEAEVQESPDVRLNRLQYTDTSGQLRQQAAINEKVAASNARNTAGGNIQNFAANRTQAGIDKLRALQGIDANEFKKRLGIANQNRVIGDKETLINQGQFLKDQEVNAANRGARRNSVSQGISELGEIAGTMGRDKNAQVNQQQLLNTLNSMGGFEVLADGSIGFKKTTT